MKMLLLRNKISTSSAETLLSRNDDPQHDHNDDNNDGSSKIRSVITCISSKAIAKKGCAMKYLRPLLLISALALTAHAVTFVLYFDAPNLRHAVTTGKSNPIDAVVTIATGKYSATRLIFTLRNAGQFDQPIYVVTDNPDEVLKHGGVPLHLHDWGPTFESDELRAKWENSEIAKVKWYKTQFFHMVPKDTNIVLFLDADVEINKPLTPFQIKVATYNADLDMTKCTSYCFKERLDTVDSHNSGTCVYFRGASSELLDEWSSEILTGVHVRDQLALDTTLKQTGLKMCNLPSKMNYYTAATWWGWAGNILSGGQMEKHAIFVHATSHKSLKDMSSENRRYLRWLGQ